MHAYYKYKFERNLSCSLELYKKEYETERVMERVMEKSSEFWHETYGRVNIELNKEHKLTSKYFLFFSQIMTEMLKIEYVFYKVFDELKRIQKNSFDVYKEYKQLSELKSLFLFFEKRVVAETFFKKHLALDYTSHITNPNPNCIPNFQYLDSELFAQCDFLLPFLTNYFTPIKIDEIQQVCYILNIEEMDILQGKSLSIVLKKEEIEMRCSVFYKLLMEEKNGPVKNTQATRSGSRFQIEGFENK